LVVQMMQSIFTNARTPKSMLEYTQVKTALL